MRQLFRRLRTFDAGELLPEPTWRADGDPFKRAEIKQRLVASNKNAGLPGDGAREDLGVCGLYDA